MFKLLTGPQTLGNGPVFWAIGALLFAISVLFGGIGDDFQVGNVTYFFVWTFMALGLCVMWGYAGILSFGQTAFFGLAGYAYSVVTINTGGGPSFTLGALAASLVLVAIAAALLGYFMFYGGVADVFVAIITLAVTLVFETFLSQTAGPEWSIGKAHLNGFNGMSGMPLLGIPWPGQALQLQGRGLYFVLLIALAVVYLALRILVNSRYGRVLVAIRENPLRATMLGYDVRRYQLTVFILGSTLGGLSGVLYVAWGQYITPSSMGLYSAVLPIIWVAVGGRKDLTATLIGTILLLYVSQTLTIYGSQYALILFGLVLLTVVMVAPEGLVVGAFSSIARSVRHQKFACSWYQRLRQSSDQRETLP